MLKKFHCRGILTGLLAVGIVFASVTIPSHSAYAIPSFAAQTGQPCSACHVGSFGPQLKPYGRDFKLYGYVTSDRPNDNFVDNWDERFTVMTQTSFTHTNKGQQGLPSGTGPNDNFTFDQAAAYYGGRITKTVGGISEWTYDGVTHSFTWDAFDIRHAWEGEVLGTDYVGGVLASNQMGNTSIWNSTPPNTFPYNSSRLEPTTSPSGQDLVNTTLTDDTLNSRIIGPGAYFLWNDWVYGEFTAYFPTSRNINNALGPTPVAQTDTYDGVIPYWHVALQHDYDNHKHYGQLGLFGATADRYPGGDKSTGNKDHITDLGVEANYQWMDDLHNMLSAHATYSHEDQNLKATYVLGSSDHSSLGINEFKADLTYTIDDTYVPSVQYFQTRGTRDATFWGTDNGSPNTQGYTIDLAYVPFGKPGSTGYNWGNMRLALEYTGYNEFGGTSVHASDHNTIFLNFWMILDPFVPLLKSIPNP